ncbi:trehalose-phosphatase [Leucobacter soli]
MAAQRETALRDTAQRESASYESAPEAESPPEVAREAAPPTAPILLTSRISGHLRRFATVPELIIACDFDGTLAPIVSRPGDARILDRAQRALQALHRAPGTHVVVLTGRSLESLLATGIDADGWVVSGSHGAELVGFETDADAPGPGLTDEESDRLAALQQRIARVFGREPGVRFESKPFGFAVHTRQVREEDRSDDILEAVSRLGEGTGLTAREGKRIREFSAKESDKGSALRMIRSRWPSAAVLFLGDDVTDEDVFTGLRIDDLGIKVGPGDTAAGERVPDPETAAAILARLAELRTGIVIGSS